MTGAIDKTKPVGSQFTSPEAGGANILVVDPHELRPMTDHCTILF